MSLFYCSAVADAFAGWRGVWPPTHPDRR